LGGVEISAFEKEFQEAGKFSDDSYAKLAALGIPKTMVDQYAAGVVAAQNAQRAEIYSVAGGEQNFAQIVQWAQTGLSDAEKTAYNDAVKSGNVAAVKLAVSGMAAKYQQNYGRDPKLVSGRASAPGPEAFTTWAQVTKAMSDPRYDSDPAYRAEVENRIAASKTL